MSPEHHDPKPVTRAIDLAIEVPGTPEEVWEAVASGPGITAWFVPAKVEGRVGGTVELTSVERVGTTVTAVVPRGEVAVGAGGTMSLSHRVV